MDKNGKDYKDHLFVDGSGVGRIQLIRKGKDAAGHDRFETNTGVK